ncbi:MAG: hypothetical protein GF393_08710 [Armatimonadia bacterium]|nr:hypothetical protein [Armatimonadia bacterium]
MYLDPVELVPVPEFERWLRYEHLHTKFWADYGGRNRRDARLHREAFAWTRV